MVTNLEGLQDFYRGDLIQLAEKIMDAKSNADDTKAFSDMMVVCEILNGENSNRFNPVEVDIRLRQEYPSIEKLEYLASQFSMRTGASGKIYDELIARLYGDARGICADVLLKHGRITMLEELIAVGRM
jgi:hypothetical protein